MRNNTIGLGVMFIVLVITIFVISKGIKKNDIITCYKLQKQSLEFDNFFITKIENEMCNAVGVPLTGIEVK